MKNHPFVPGKDQVLYAQPIYGKQEVQAVIKCLSEGWLGVGRYCKEFEKRVSEIFGQNYGLFVNSGSSANFLAIRALNLPVGGEVITPACTFSTTLNPLLESGLVPVFVDVEADTYNVNLDLVWRAIGPKTVALMIPHLLGNLNDTKRLRQMADIRGLKLIEDSCDTIGGTVRDEKTGKYADASTTSFYATHIMTAMGMGGMVMFKEKSHLDKAQVLRDWGRAAAEPFDEHPDIRFDHHLDGVKYDGKFVFCERGFNFKANDPLAAFGLVQLSRLEEFSLIRKKNFQTMYDFFAEFKEHFILPRQALHYSDVRWLAFPITIRKDSPIQRTDLMLYLEKKKIQTRVLFAGNILRHPPYKGIKHRVFGELTNSDNILAQSMLIGCHHGLHSKHLEYVMEVVEEYIKKI